MSSSSESKQTSNFLWLLMAGPLLTLILGGLPFIPKFFQRPRNGYFLSLGITLLMLIIPRGRQFLTKKFFPWLSLKLEHDLRYWYWFLGFQLLVLLKVVLLNYFSLNVNAIDYSFYDYLIPATFKGMPFYSPACDCNHFGIHSTFTHFFLLSPQAIIQHPLFSNIMHALFIWSSWLPLYLIGKHYKIRHNHLFLIIFGFLNLNLISHILSYNYHVEVAYLPLFLWLFYAFETKQKMLFYMVALLIAGVKEDGAVYLAAFPFAAFLIDKRRPYWTLPLILISFIIFYVNIKFVIPSQADNTYRLTDAAAKYGSHPVDIIKAVLSSPLKFMTDFFGSGWPKYLMAFAWVPLLLPFFWIATGPYLFIHSLAASEVMRKYGLYYGAPFLPFCLYAIVIFLGNRSWIEDKIKIQKFKNFIPLFIFVWGLYFGGGSFRFVPYLSDYWKISSTLQRLPKEAKVCAQSSLFPLLSYNLSARLISDSCIDNSFEYYALSDHTNPYPHQMEKIKRLIQSFKNDQRYKIMYDSKNMVLFKRNDAR